MIQSQMIRESQQKVIFLMYDTYVDGKHVICACGVGKVIGDDAELTPVGFQTLNALMEYTKDLTGRAVRLFEIGFGRSVPKRVRKGLEWAGEKDALFFVCRSHEIYDAAVRELNVIG